MKARLALVALLAAAPLPARAHPHVLIDAHAVVLFDQGKVTGLQMGWKFDPVYSSTLVQDFDKNKNATLDPDELAAIEKDAFQGTSEYSYFTYAKADGKLVTWPKAERFQVMVVKDALVYAFHLRLPEPVDPRKQSLKVTTYEETYYIDIDFPNDAAVKLTGTGAEGCDAVLGQDMETPLWGGVVFPRKVDIRCR